MSHQVVNLTYTGEISGLVGHGKTIAFVVRHKDGVPGSLFRIDGESNKQVMVELPCGGLSILWSGERYWIGGEDQHLYSMAVDDKSVKKHKAVLPAGVTAMAPLAENRLALLAGQTLVIVNEKAKVLQSLELEQPGTALAAHSDGHWLAVGMEKGRVAVFQCEEQQELKLSEAEDLHDGSVTAILFEPEELRFFSAGADRKLWLTHARGRLEPEDRGRSNGHEKWITSMILAGSDRFITGGLDKVCKSWARAGATKPATLSDGLVAVVDLATIEVHKRTNLVVAGGDSSLRLFLLNDDGRIGNPLTRYNDGFARVQHLFQSSEAADRGLAMQELVELGSRQAVEMLAERVKADSDNQLRLTAAKLLAKSSHPQLGSLLHAHLKHQDAPIRGVVLESLEKVRSDSPIELYQSAISTEHADIGTRSIESLVKLAKAKACSEADRNLILFVLTDALNSSSVEIRNAAIFGLEALFEKNSTRPNLITLDAVASDTRRKGMIRLYQRDLLAEPTVAAGLRRAVEDKHAEVRQTAFLVSVLARPDLSAVLRKRDKDLDRQLKELEKFDFDSNVSASKASSAKKKRATKKAKR